MCVYACVEKVRNFRQCYKTHTNVNVNKTEPKKVHLLYKKTTKRSNKNKQEEADRVWRG